MVGWTGSLIGMVLTALLIILPLIALLLGGKYACYLEPLSIILIGLIMKTSHNVLIQTSNFLLLR